MRSREGDARCGRPARPCCLLSAPFAAARQPALLTHPAKAPPPCPTLLLLQDLARPGVVERFAASSDDAALLRSFFAGLWGLEDVSEPTTVAGATRDRWTRNGSSFAAAT